MDKHNKNAYGIVWCGVLFMAFVNAPLFSCAGIFVIPVSTDLGISRTLFSLNSTVSNIGGFIAALGLGSILNRFGMRKVLLGFSFIDAAAYLGFSLTNSIWQQLPMSFLLGACTVMLGMVPIASLINSRCPPSHRGRALGIALAGTGIGTFILGPLLTWVNNTRSWRTSYQILAILVFFTLIPSVWFFTRDNNQTPPRDRNSLEGSHRKSPQQSSSSGIRNLFLLCLLIRILAHGTATMFTATAFSHICDTGYASSFASAMVSVTSVSIIVGKLLLGEACDKYGVKGVAMVCTTSYIAAAALICFLPAGNILPVLSSVFGGFGVCTCTLVLTIREQELLGPDGYAKLGGFLQTGMYIGSGIAPVLASSVYDHVGNYIPAWLSSIAASVGLIFLILFSYHCPNKKTL